MAVMNRRNRLVNFRLSEQELEALKSVCYTHGARSISDFARGAVLRLIDSPVAQQETNQNKISNLDQKVGELENRLGLLYQLLDGQHPVAREEGHSMAQRA